MGHFRFRRKRLTLADSSPVGVSSDCGNSLAGIVEGAKAPQMIDTTATTTSAILRTKLLATQLGKLTAERRPARDFRCLSGPLARRGRPPSW